MQRPNGAAVEFAQARRPDQRVGLQQNAPVERLQFAGRSHTLRLANRRQSEVMLPGARKTIESVVEHFQVDSADLETLLKTDDFTADFTITTRKAPSNCENR